eukprot:9504002-Pyramimonas_sp.AAC.1
MATRRIATITRAKITAARIVAGSGPAGIRKMTKMKFSMAMATTTIRTRPTIPSRRKIQRSRGAPLRCSSDRGGRDRLRSSAAQLRAGSGPASSSEDGEEFLPSGCAARATRSPMDLEWHPEALGFPRGEGASTDSDVIDRVPRVVTARPRGSRSTEEGFLELRLLQRSARRGDGGPSDRARRGDLRYLDRDPRSDRLVTSPVWATLEQGEEWMRTGVKQSGSEGSGILDIGAASSIAGI